MLYLKNTPLDQILSLSEIIEAVEDALRALATGAGFDLPRRRIHHPGGMIFGMLPGSAGGGMGAYIQTDLNRRIHHESVIVYSVETGEPLILFQDCSINELRTGAAGALGAKYLARIDAGRVALFGSAVHARMQLKAAGIVRTLTHVKVFSPTEQHRNECVDKLRSELASTVVETAKSAQEALEGADIVITATNSRTPVFDGSWITDGMHVTSISNGDAVRTRQEIDEATIRRADSVFVTSKETVSTNRSDIFRAARDGIIQWDDVHEISELLLGKVPGRSHDRQITLFKLQGIGIMDVAVGMRAYERLRDSKLVQQL
ncbi:MAG TPA: ornithine cyclodeaminase family protein [Candidatus Binatia bacterium]|jgi:ornithine cyclodeaminase/alanine dehydrogenase-like protein (mu-crystallin family)